MNDLFVYVLFIAERQKRLLHAIMHRNSLNIDYIMAEEKYAFYFAMHAQRRIAINSRPSFCPSVSNVNISLSCVIGTIIG